MDRNCCFAKAAELHPVNKLIMPWTQENHPNISNEIIRKCFELFCWSAICIVELPTELILSVFECFTGLFICDDCKTNEHPCYRAACNGHMECLTHAHISGYPLSAWICTVAAAKGYLQILKYAFTHGCPLNDDAIRSAFMHRRRECLAYIYEQRPDLFGLRRYYNGYDRAECLEYVLADENS